MKHELNRMQRRKGMAIRRPRYGMTTTQYISILLVIILMLVTFAYLSTSETSSLNVQSLQTVVSNLQAQINSQSKNVTLLKSQLSSLPTMNQKPQVRNIKVEWTNILNAGQDRFFSQSITVNQGDTVVITFVSNDTDAHTFTLESPYDFQINATVPGSLDYLQNETVFTTPATHNSPGVRVFGTPGNVTGIGSFVAKYPGIYEYFCVYHVQLGMFGYLIVLPNQAYSSSNQTTPVGHESFVNITAGAGTNQSSTGFFPSPITVVLGVNNTVTWTNDDSFPHTVTADDGNFSSGNLNPGESYSFTFATPGTYTYHCSYHPWMKGEIIVKSG